MRRENLSAANVGILCPTNKDCRVLAESLPKEFNARYFNTSELRLDHRGVKVLTMHAAKGLQFPLVVVAGLRRGSFPFKVPVGQALEDHKEIMQRLFFVACSRAMRGLAVCFHRDEPSEFLQLLDKDDWAEASDYSEGYKEFLGTVGMQHLV